MDAKNGRPSEGAPVSTGSPRSAEKSRTQSREVSRSDPPQAARKPLERARSEPNGLQTEGGGKWLRTESNRRHADFQSAALPTELLSLFSPSGGRGFRVPLRVLTTEKLDENQAAPGTRLSVSFPPSRGGSGRAGGAARRPRRRRLRRCKRRTLPHRTRCGPCRRHPAVRRPRSAT